MIPENWQEIENLYDALVKQGTACKPCLLRELCGGDEDLGRQVESLFEADACVQGFLETPALEIAAPWLTDRELESPTGPLASGEQIGPYRIVEPLGQGGMGIVYRARDTRLDRDVALKLLPERSEQDPQVLERFKREARAVSALNHPNICTLYDIGEYHGQPFLVLELLEGQSLRDVLDSGPMAITELLDVALQIAGALEAAHAKGIVHRDIKPANIFVNTAGQVKVLDFGLAKLLSEPERVGADAAAAAGSSTLATISVMGRAMGTASYMSPEQARGDDVDARSDLFSLAVVLYQLATGSRPFEGETPAITVEAILGSDPVPPRQRNPAVSPQLERIILKALEKDRDMRYQTAAELCADLGRLRRPASWRYRWLTAAATLVTALGMTVVGVRFGWFGTPPPAPDFTPRQVTANPAEDPVIRASISPDGRFLSFQDLAGIHIRSIETGSTRSIPPPEGTCFR
ncbi:MAG: serine/threonine protein kinase [Bryobacterales bacterium]|nr:serine/threonine protein kinase [Bryobacterales bacterium]